jgi:predicted RNA-binding Zn-ribbon protein involved in translation (DUF1610 family)
LFRGGASRVRRRARSTALHYVSEAPLDWLFASLAVFAVAVAGWWLWRRRHIERGLLCWNCGADLSDKRLYVDFKGRSRCPKCGNEMDVTDTYKMPLDQSHGDSVDK